MIEPLYYADGRRVFKRPVDRINPDGTHSSSLGFPLCDLADWVDEEGAQAIADALNHSAGLTFAALRQATQARKSHPPAFTACADWTIADWFMALEGEAGELGNQLKKVRRGDVAPDDPRIAEELGDVQIYLDLLAAELGVNLGAATVAKFNATSEEIGSPVTLSCEEG